MNPTNLLMFSLPAVSRLFSSLSRNSMAIRFAGTRASVGNFRPRPLTVATVAALFLATATSSHAVILNYSINQEFVGGDGDHDAYMPDGFDGYTCVTGSLNFSLPDESNHAAYETGSYTDTSVSQPLTLTFGGTTFQFGGPLALTVSVANKHIGITAWGDDAYVEFNFFGDDYTPDFDSDPITNLLNLSQWGGYIDFYHANGSYLYTDMGTNMGYATIVEIPDGGSTLLLLCLGLGGLGILVRLRKAA